MMGVQGQGGMGILLRDLLFQVLLRLSLKTLGRFRCVSKQWLDLISDPLFINLHTSETKKKKLRLGLNHVPGSCKYDITIIDPIDANLVESFSLSFPTDTYKIVYGSGILLFYGTSKYIHVCNPSTREVSTIRNLPSHIQTSFSNKYDFTSSRIVLTAFAFLPSTSQHKIIDLLNIGSKRHPRMKGRIVILPNKDTPGSWKYFTVDLDVKYCPDGKTICVNGIIYWEKLISVEVESKILKKVLTFDLEAEEFRLLACPCTLVDQVVDLNGLVCLVDVNSSEFVLSIWVLEDSKNEIWAKEYTINYPSYIAERDIVPLGIIDDGNGIKAMIIEFGFEKFYYYDLKNKTFTTFHYDWKNKTFMKLGKGKKCSSNFIHYGSLVSVSSCGLVNYDAHNFVPEIGI